jgi:hypothetical protein
MGDLVLARGHYDWRLWLRDLQDDCRETWRAITIREVEGGSGWLNSQPQAARHAAAHNQN